MAKNDSTTFYDDGLKPCPFCGGAASVREYANGHNGDGEYTARYKVGCEKCAIFFDRESSFSLVKGYPKFVFNGYEAATRAWNSRSERKAD